jgi:hypothetical protein
VGAKGGDRSRRGGWGYASGSGGPWVGGRGRDQRVQSPRSGGARTPRLSQAGCSTGSQDELAPTSFVFEVSKSRCRACQASLFSVSGVSPVGLNENANTLRRHGFRKQVSLG